MNSQKINKLQESLRQTADFYAEVLSNEELWLVTGGDGASSTVSQCHSDGNMEPGTS